MSVSDLEKKVCTECLTEKSLSEYYTQNRNSSTRGDYVYYNPRCKECVAKASMKWERDNPRRHREIVRRRDSVEWRKERKRIINRERAESGKYLEWQRNNKDKIREYRVRYGSKKHVISEDEWVRCKDYFDFSCAYCGMSETTHRKTFNQQLHKEHVVHDGRDDIKNCVPSCKSCNGSKYNKPLNEWYNSSNPNYTRERYLKIYQWMRYDCNTK